MKIPPHAKLAYSGKIFEVFTFEQELYDGSKATFERIRRPDTVLIITQTEDSIILIDDTQPDRGTIRRLPGGRMDKGETPLSCAKRELSEETGYESDSWEEYLSYSPVDKMEWTIHILIAKNAKKTSDPSTDPGELIQVFKVSFDEFIETMTNETNWGNFLCSKILSMDDNAREGFRRKVFGR